MRDNHEYTVTVFETQTVFSTLEKAVEYMNSYKLIGIPCNIVDSTGKIIQKYPEGEKC